jgi:hypothetical protein
VNKRNTVVSSESETDRDTVTMWPNTNTSDTE